VTVKEESALSDKVRGKQFWLQLSQIFKTRSWMQMLMLLLLLPATAVQQYLCLQVTACGTRSCCSVDCKFRIKIPIFVARRRNL
jgi:hypothetical protein